MRYFYLSSFHFITPGRVKYKEANGPIYIGETSVNTWYTNKILSELVLTLHQNNTDTLIKQILATVQIINL